ncbi:MAG TPA: cbb3-type cytochrome c oxidase subunit I, partial [Bacillaceae bacterium]
MGNIFIFTLAAAILFTFLAVPLMSSGKGKRKKKHGDGVSNLKIEFAIAFVAIWLILFAVYYLSNVDRTVSSLWLPLLIFSVIETFSKRPIFAYPLMVLALITIGFFAFGLWVHHMFATGLPR